MRIQFFPVESRLPPILIATLLGLGGVDAAHAQPSNQAAVPAAQTTLAIFSDRPMPEQLWPVLVAALRAEIASGSPEVRALVNDPAAQIQIIRGDEIEPGLVVGNSVSVFLHGECVTRPTPHPDLFGQPVASSVLGWVKIDNGLISPFIHVECEHIGHVLGLEGIGRNRDQRNQLMAIAISRVILHEWIHIATQNPHHSKHGLSKAQFGVADLVAKSGKPGAQWGMRTHADD